ncbi:hypothetical protein F5X99DRAFT_387729 [Biscogniauxia marginata]|nr:hypothetical protein F5X99DRAFT_387729 [Biscogniauxia marginata]
MTESTTRLPTAKKNPKFDRIDIWRTEVSLSRVYCVCSAPATTAEAANTSKESLSAPASASVSASGSSTATNSTAPTESSKKSKLRLDLPIDEQVACPVCSSPIDADVSYVSFSKDGAGLVRITTSSQSEANIKRLEEGGSSKGKKFGKETLLKAVSGVFKNAKTIDLAKASQALPSPSSDQDRSTVNNRKRNLADPDEASRSRTEMYHLLRREDRVGGRGGNDVDVGALGKSPKASKQDHS